MKRSAIVATAALALAGCGRTGGGDADREAAQPPANITIATAEGRTEIRTGGGAVASGLPDGIPPYPGAETNAAVQISGASPQGQGGIYGFRTSDPPARVIAFYAEAAGRAGYTIANQMNLGRTAALTAQKGESVINVTATEAGGATQGQLIVGYSRR